MADWLPKSYLFSQVTILMLGFWAIVNRGSVIQIELVRFFLFDCDLRLPWIFFAYTVISHQICFDYSRFDCDWNVFWIRKKE